MEYRVAFEFVIGLSNEEPLNRRTTTQPTLVAAKVWASLYPSSKRNVGVFREELSIQINQLRACGAGLLKAWLRHNAAGY